MHPFSLQSNVSPSWVDFDTLFAEVTNRVNHCMLDFLLGGVMVSLSIEPRLALVLLVATGDKVIVMIARINTV